MTVPGTSIGGIEVSWQPPADDGGTPVTGYVLCRSTTSGGPAFCATLGAATSYSDSGAILQSYFYTVRANNMVGQGAASAEACTKPFPWLSALGC